MGGRHKNWRLEIVDPIGHKTTRPKLSYDSEDGATRGAAAKARDLALTQIGRLVEARSQIYIKRPDGTKFLFKPVKTTAVKKPVVVPPGRAGMQKLTKELAAERLVILSAATWKKQLDRAKKRRPLTSTERSLYKAILKLEKK